MAKRFWHTAGVAAAENGWHVMLDTRAVRLPQGETLLIGTAALAEAIAEEWRRAGGGGIGGSFTAADTELTGLAGTAQGRVALQRAGIVDQLARYAEADVLCYRTDVPAGLAERQAVCWQPWLDWAASRHDARLSITTGLAHIAQHPGSLARLRGALEALSTAALAALGLAIPALGSCVLGLALAEAQLDADTAFELSVLDELYQASRWGEDAEAALRREAVRRDIALAVRFMELSRR